MVTSTQGKKSMFGIRRREFITLVGGVASVCSFTAWAQQAATIHKVGFLSPTGPSFYRPAFFDALAKLGWVEGTSSSSSAMQTIGLNGCPDSRKSAFDAARKRRPDALITVEDPLTLTYRRRIADFAVLEQLPSIFGIREDATAGGLISYGANATDLFRRAAGYVDKILVPLSHPAESVCRI